MYNIIVDLVTSLMVNNLDDIIVTVVAQPTWVTYLTCVYLISKLINIGIDTPTPQQPNMKPAIMFLVNETWDYYTIFHCLIHISNARFASYS